MHITCRPGKISKPLLLHKCQRLLSPYIPFHRTFVNADRQNSVPGEVQQIRANLIHRSFTCHASPFPSQNWTISHCRGGQSRVSHKTMFPTHLLSSTCILLPDEPSDRSRFGNYVLESMAKATGREGYKYSSFEYMRSRTQQTSTNARKQSRIF